MALHSALYSFTWGKLSVIGLISGIRLYFSGPRRFIFAAHLKYYLSQYTLSNVGTETLHSTNSFIFCNSYLYNIVGRVAQSVLRLSYGLDGPGSNPGVDEIFRPPRPALGHTQTPVKWVPGLPGGKVRPGRAADNSPPSSAAVMEE